MRALVATLVFVLCAGTGAHAQQTIVKLVFFTADWCPNCQVLEPEIARAVARVSGVERVDIDITTFQRQIESVERAQRRAIAPLYVDYAGKTGFAVVADAASGAAITCVTSAYSAAEIEGVLRRAVSGARPGPAQKRPDGRPRSCPAAYAEAGSPSR